MPAQDVRNLLRGCNPAPGARGLHGETKLQIFDCHKSGAIDGEPGAISSIDDSGAVIALKGRSIQVRPVRANGCKKVAVVESDLKA